MKEEITKAISELAKAEYHVDNVTFDPVVHEGVNYLLLVPPIADAPCSDPEKLISGFRQAFKQHTALGESLVRYIGLAQKDSKMLLMFAIDEMIKEKEKEKEKIKSPDIEFKVIPLSEPPKENKNKKIDLPSEIPSDEREEIQHPLETIYLLNIFLKIVQAATQSKIKSLSNTPLGYYANSDKEANGDWISINPVVTKTEMDVLEPIIVRCLCGELNIEESKAKAMVKSWVSGSNKGMTRIAIKVSEFKGLLNPETAEPLYIKKQHPSKEEKYSADSKDFMPSVKKLKINVAPSPDEKAILVGLDPSFDATGEAPPVNLILLIDSSGSMAEVFYQIQEQIINFMRGLLTNPKNSSIYLTLINFSNYANVVFANTQVKTKEEFDSLTLSVLYLKADGGTDICAGMRKTIEHCKAKNNRIIFVTDGEQSERKSQYKDELGLILKGLNLEFMVYMGLIAFSSGASLAQLNVIRDAYYSKTERTLPFDYTDKPDQLTELFQAHFNIVLQPVLPPASITIKISGMNNNNRPVEEKVTKTITSFLIGSNQRIITVPFSLCTEFTLEIIIQTLAGVRLKIAAIESDLEYNKDKTGSVSLSGNFEQLKLEEQTSMSSFVEKHSILSDEYKNKKITSDGYLKSLKNLENEIKQTIKAIQLNPTKKCQILPEFCEVVRGDITQIGEENSRKVLGTGITKVQRGKYTHQAAVASNLACKYR